MVSSNVLDPTYGEGLWLFRSITSYRHKKIMASGGMDTQKSNALVNLVTCKENKGKKRTICND